jgi:hypothetical protein
MKYLFLICAGLLLLALGDLPIGFYTFLRIFITIVAIASILYEFKLGITFWAIAFGIIAIIFNPIIPIYLNNKSAWIPIDVLSAGFFLIKSFTLKTAQ